MTLDAPTAAGFFGKLPARGDFVRAGLPRDFVDSWDGWWQRMLPGSRDRLGEGWTEAWLQAPIWRFALPPGLCGAGAVLGLWMPSVDQAGRFFPLTIAMTARSLATLLRTGGGFLDVAEAAGLAAVQNDMPPDTLAARIATAAEAPDAATAAPMPEPGAATWWTDGSPIVAAQTVSGHALPDVDAFTTMIAGLIV